jgi:hypothetical protein
MPSSTFSDSPAQQGLEGLLPAIILDRNSQIGCHKLMKAGAVVDFNRAQQRARGFAE